MNEADFLNADKHESLLHIDMILMGMVKHSQSSQNSKFAISLQYLCNMPSLLTGMIKHSQITQSNEFAISLQNLKKEIRNGVHSLQYLKK